MSGVSKIIGLFRGKTLTTAERLESALAKGRITGLELKNVQGVKNEALRESLSFSLAKFSKGGEKSRRTLGQIDDLTYKFNLCDDAFVNEEAQRILTSATSNPKIRKKELRKAIDKAEHLLDAANTANGRYSTLFTDMNPTGYMSPFAKKLNNTMIKFVERLRGGKIKLTPEIVTYSNPRQTYTHCPEIAKAKGFKRFVQFDSLSRYTARYKDNPELLTHLYNNHYLKQVDNETAEFLRGIDANYGTKIFLAEPLSKSQKVFIQEELKAFKEAGLTDFPPALEINPFDLKIMKNHFAGFSVSSKLDSRIGRYVKLRTGNDLAGGTMRHEFIHQFDRNTSGWQRMKALFSPKAKISAAEAAEMRASGLHDGNIAYARTETADFVAVAGQRDATKYSKEFAQRLVKLGLPEEVLRMKPVSLERHVYQSFSNIEDLKLLDEVKLACGGKIPMGLQMDLIDNPKHIKRVRGLLHLNCSTNAKQAIQSELAWYVKGIKPETYKDPELVKLLDLQVKGGHPAYNLYDLQAAHNSSPEALEAFKKYADVRNLSGDTFLGHAFIGCQNKEQVNAAERLLNIQINGEFPYQNIDQMYGIKDIVLNIPPEKLSKACTNIEKAAQNGEVRNLNEYLGRYMALRHN